MPVIDETPLPTTELGPGDTGHIDHHVRVHDAYDAELFANTVNVMHADYGAADGGDPELNTDALNLARADIVATGKPGLVLIPLGVDLPVVPDDVLGASMVHYGGGGKLSTTQSTAGALITYPPGSTDFSVKGLAFKGGSDLIRAVALSSTPGNITRRGVIADNVCEECLMGDTNPHDTISGLGYDDYDTDPVTGNVTRDIDWINNRGTRTAPNLGSHAFIQLWYAMGGKVEGNTADGYPYGITGWYGDADPDADGDPGNERKGGGHRVIGNEMTNVLDVLGAGAGIWFSMGKDIVVSGANHVENCADVGIDFEGCVDCRAEGNVVTNAANGCLTTFSYNRGIHFGANTCRQDTPGALIARVANDHPTGDNQDVTFDGGTFDGPNGIVRIALETAQRLTVRNIIGTNVRIGAQINNVRTTTIEDNSLTFTVAGAAGDVDGDPEDEDRDFLFGFFNAINVGYNHLGGRVIVRRNTIESLVAQLSTSRAIRSYQDDPTQDVLEFIDDNILLGWTTPIETIWDGANAGFTARTRIRRNTIDHVSTGAVILNTRGPASIATGIAATIIRQGNEHTDGTSAD